LTASAWFPHAPLGGVPELRLFCLHHAGAGASTYRDWQGLVGNQIEVVPVQLPGRETRFAEPAERSIRRLSRQLTTLVLERAAGAPFAFFGHSMGALLAYDLTRELETVGRPPAHLVVSAHSAPHVRDARAVHTFPDDEFLAYVLKLEGTPSDVRNDPALLEVILPVLRADFTACETYEHEAGCPLAVPVTVFGGDRDPSVNSSQLRRWAELTTAPTTVELFPGGHFYLAAHRDRMLASLLRALAVGHPGVERSGRVIAP
jgi:surfactin synthase thioesterase subunit